MQTIKLTKGFFAKVDDADYEWLIQWRWRVTIGSGCGTKPYAVRTGQKHEGKLWKKNIYMHRQIANPPDDKVVDHLNSDGLDNQRHNFEITTTKENNLRNIAFALQMGWGTGPRRC